MGRSSCHIFFASCDVRLDRHDYTVVQSDIMITCRRIDIRAARFEGALDLIVEIMSDSTRFQDQYPETIAGGTLGRSYVFQSTEDKKWF